MSYNVTTSRLSPVGATPLRHLGAVAMAIVYVYVNVYELEVWMEVELWLVAS